MKAVDFPESNQKIAEKQDEYITLSAYIGKNDSNGYLTTCWKASLRERLLFLFTGKIYLSVMTFNKPLQPLMMHVDKWKLLSKPYFKSKKKE